MSDLENLTPFGYGFGFGYQPDDRAAMVLCVAGRFRIPSGGTTQSSPLQALDEQQPPPMCEEFWGDPADSSLRAASQAVVVRTRAEAYVSGSAWAPRGQPTIATRTRVRVGATTKEVHVVGNRRWKSRGRAAVASEPEPFTSMPLRYEHAYGGTVRSAEGQVLLQEPSNPVGCGLFAGVEEADGQPLPNLYAQGETSPRWRQPVRPACYGPIPPSWQPRAKFVGTFDGKWLEERVPLWPRDLDARYFCAAAEGLSAEARTFREGEPVELDGFSPDGPIRFELPAYRVIAKSEFADRTTRKCMDLDAILVEPDQLSVTLYWRAVVPVGYGSSAYLRSVVRLLEPWETAPA